MCKEILYTSVAKRAIALIKKWVRGRTTGKLRSAVQGVGNQNKAMKIEIEQ